MNRKHQQANASLSRRAILKSVVAGVATNKLPLRYLAVTEPNAPIRDLTTTSVVRLASAIRRREVSCVEVIDAYVRRIESLNPALNAVVRLDKNGARRAAVAADQALRRRDRIGPLHGVPMTVKDSFDTAGIITTGGTAGRRSFVPVRDATAVARLRAAGAIILGKSNTSELTLSYETDNLVYGRTSNPYDVSRTSGGSSGGAAAAIAAGCSPLDICSDTGGSVRVPSHFCGIAGLKPTSGRIPRTGHIISFEGVFQPFTQPGPMARFVEDLIMVFPILAGPDGIDPWIVPASLRDPHVVSLRGLRICLQKDNGIRTPEAPCVQSAEAAAHALTAAGCTVEEFRPSDIAATYDLGNRLWRAAGSASVRRLLAASGTTEVSLPLRAWLNSSPTKAEDWTALLEQLDQARSRMLALFATYDAILCPPSAFTALKHGATQREDLDSGFSYSEVFNYLGWPAAVVRCGTTEDGLPVGVEIISSPWREDIVLAVAQELEHALGGWQPGAHRTSACSGLAMSGLYS